jgi:hypothetical protein
MPLTQTLEPVDRGGILGYSLERMWTLGPTSAILDLEQMRNVVVSVPGFANIVDPSPTRCGDANFGASTAFGGSPSCLGLRS